jgi:hypothetical protein
MREYSGSDINLHGYFMLDIYRDEWLSLKSRHFTPKGSVLCTNWITYSLITEPEGSTMVISKPDVI